MKALPYVSREASCTGKVRLRSRRLAKRVARRTMAMGGRPLVHYRCRFCGFWHVGHRPRHAVMPS